MNSFLGNLIDRHQEFSDHRQIGYKVQPRPKVRFETEPITTTAMDHDTLDDSEIARRSEPESEAAAQGKITERTPSAQLDSPLETHERIDKPGAQSIHSDLFDDMNELNEAISERLGGKLPTQREQLQRIEAQPFQQNEAIETASSLSSGSEQSSDAQFSLEGELNNRMEEILQRLRHQHPVRTEKQGGLEYPTEPIMPDSNNNEIFRPTQHVGQAEIRAEGSGRSIRSQFQTDNRHSDYRVSQQPGLLQIPGWLAAMRADLHNRWREINNQVEAEPVVNVTIGRVEVRAVQADSAKQPKTRNKPSGVMSLDDYLKQRERRGQA